VHSLDRGVAANTISIENGATKGRDSLRQGVLAELPTDTRLLGAAEGNIRLQDVRAVDPRRARVDGMSGAKSLVNVRGEDGRRKAVGRVVGHVDNIYSER
jgi:hypothetical protein